MLHENRIAEDFRISRTPVRQVLQRLAYERLVETRSGVGTVAVPLLDTHRTRDLATLIVLFRAGATLGGETASQVARLELETCTAEAWAERALSAQAFLELHSRMLEVLRALPRDPIVADAQVAAHWRAIRWSMRDFLTDPDAERARLARAAETIAAETRSDGMLRAAASSLVTAEATGDFP